MGADLTSTEFPYFEIVFFARNQTLEGFLALVAIKIRHYENLEVLKEPKIEYEFTMSLPKASLRHHHCRH